MKINTAAKAVLIMIFLIAPATAWAQSAAGATAPVEPARKELKTKMFEVRYKNVNSLADVLRGLASFTGGAQVNPNANLKIITVRDYPENIAVIEDALKRLDVPEPALENLEVRLHLIATSKTSTEKGSLPQGLDGVINQLQTTLKFPGYRYVTTILNRTRDGGKVEASGNTGTLFAIPVNTAQPSFYQFRTQVGLAKGDQGKLSVYLQSFNFSIRTPIVTKTKADGAAEIQYTDVGINTDLSIREGEMAVVGTANVGTSDEAIIVVVSVKKVE